MTREEQLDWLYRLKSKIYVYMPKEWIIPMNNALDMTIKALEQEPCEDCISRQAVLEIQAKYAEDIGATKFWQMRDDIKALPSVTPQPKTDTLDKIRAEIEKQEKWLLQAGYNAYNVDIAFNSIKSVLAESEVKE